MATITSPPAPADNFDEDPFAHTAMSFGEHLEELRASLFKAVLALFAGFLFGMLFGTQVVNLIQLPLENALSKYYINQNVEQIREKLQARADNGDEVAQRMLANPDFQPMIEAGMLCEQSFVLPEELFAEFKQHFPAALAGVELPARQGKLRREDLIPIYQWHAIVDDDRVKLRALGAQEPFVIWLKASFLTGAIVSSPFVFYFIWSFLAAGLYAHEKRYVHIFLPFSVCLFLLGALTAFVFVFPPVLNFFFSFNRAMGIDPDLRISEWMSFVLMMPLAFGISFQLPLVMLFLERIGIFDVNVYLAKWRIAVLVISIVSMVLSPGGDPYSMLLMMGPLVGLYFLGIGLCRWMPSSQSTHLAG